MPGILLDTPALVWLVNGERGMTADALAAIANGQRDGALYVSSMTGWELSVAPQKAPGAGRPDLGGHSARTWLSEALKLTTARLIPISRRIAFEAAEFPEHYGRRTLEIAS